MKGLLTELRGKGILGGFDYSIPSLCDIVPTEQANVYLGSREGNGWCI
jgi:hypothetical protein